MKCIAIQSSPNTDGLTAGSAQAVLDGFEAEGGEVELLHLNQMDIRPCLACEEGWGNCRDGDCIQDDDLVLIRGKIAEADALVFATPVYWHDLSESAKRFLDRLRRTETFSSRDTYARALFIILLPLTSSPEVALLHCGVSRRGPICDPLVHVIDLGEVIPLEDAHGGAAPVPRPAVDQHLIILIKLA